MASTSFRDFLEIREKEIKELRSQLLVELREIKTAKMAIQSDDSTEDSEPKKTIKDMVQEVLIEHGDGGSADQIIEWIAESFKIEIARSSLSPQLSRLKSEGILTTGPADGFWRLRRMMPSGRRVLLDEDSHSTSDAQFKVRRRPTNKYR